MTITQRHEDDHAIFSDDERYRYWLYRELDHGTGGTVAFLMLNPSTADAFKNDPTVRRCVGYAVDWGYSSLVVVNLFAYRATQPKWLRHVDDPVGILNNRYIRDACQSSKMVIAAWGGSLIARERWFDYKRTEWAQRGGSVALHCLALTQDEAPRNPLYLRKDLKPVPFHG